MMGDTVLLMFPALIVLIALGIPIAFSMMLVALGFGLVRFGDILILQIAQRVDEVATNYVLGAIPLFIFMGAILERAGIAERLFDAIYMWTRRLPGGLAIAALLMCTIFAAASGVVGATETLVGMLAIPGMLKRNYNHSLIAGTVCAGGSLGTVIPPSIPVIVLAPIAALPVGDLLAGILLPGLLMAAMFAIYIIGICIIKPSFAPG
ncbi:MAG: TRAP transporter large permease subunit, partial [Aurantimonas coralicida]